MEWKQQKLDMHSIFSSSLHFKWNKNDVWVSECECVFYTLCMKLDYDARVMFARARFIWYGSLERTSLISVQFAVYFISSKWRKTTTKQQQQQNALTCSIRWNISSCDVCCRISFLRFIFVFVCLFVRSILCVNSMYFFSTLILQRVSWGVFICILYACVQNNKPLYGYSITNIYSHTHQNSFNLNLLASHTL